jgi:hypothetical protein
MMAAEVSGLTANQIGVPDSFHPTHITRTTRPKSKGARRSRRITEIMAKFAAKLGASRMATLDAGSPSILLTAAT